MSRLLLAVALFLGCAAPVSAADVGADYAQGPGGYYRKDDRSGPYAIGSDSVPRLLSGGNSGGSSTVTGSIEQDVRTTGTLNTAALNAAITTSINGQGTVGYTFSGLTGTGATLTYEQSIDGGTTWTGINAVNRGTGVPEATRTTDGQIALSATGRTTIRARVSTAGTGTVTVATNVSVREGIFSLGSPLPPGSNALGSVLADLRVAGAPNASGNPIFAQITNFPATQTVAGTVTANLGTLNGAATAANQTSTIAALGAVGDTAYAGSGNASAIAAQKGIYAATVARQASFVEANSAAIAANGLSPQTARASGATYTKFNATAGCTAANANLVVDGSNDGFASYVTIAITAVAANSRNSGSAGSTITAPVNFTSYRAYVANGATANTCSVVSSFTVN